MAAPIAGSFPCPVEIRTDDPEGCPAFYGRVVRGVRNGPSPAWLQQRLKAVGQRPISALVDMTNYIMLSYGRPLHVYDLAKLSGAVVARKARAGETVEALNGKTYHARRDDDRDRRRFGRPRHRRHHGRRAFGRHRSDHRHPDRMRLFRPGTAIARTGQKLGLASDARSRFERGVDPRFVDTGTGARDAAWRSNWPAASRPKWCARASRRLERGRSPIAPSAAPRLAGSTCRRSPGRNPRTARLRRRARRAVARDRRRRGGRDVEGEADIVEEVDPRRRARQGGRRRRCRARPASPGRPPRPSR